MEGYGSIRYLPPELAAAFSSGQFRTCTAAVGEPVVAGDVEDRDRPAGHRPESRAEDAC